MYWLRCGERPRSWSKAKAWNLGSASVRCYHYSALESGHKWWLHVIKLFTDPKHITYSIVSFFVVRFLRWTGLITSVTARFPRKPRSFEAVWRHCRFLSGPRTFTLPCYTRTVHGRCMFTLKNKPCDISSDVCWLLLECEWVIAWQQLMFLEASFLLQAWPRSELTAFCAGRCVFA